ncbi:MAG: hypothetical protein DIJKHBIC_01094 [Thermoanaerobaculia bacterium]|nr:hypothetical protein [Thermoanaerobaculia bacterium]
MNPVEASFTVPVRVPIVRVTVISAVWTSDPRVAVIVATASPVTGTPVIAKVPVDWPEAIVAFAGTVATFVSLEESATVTPDGPAGPLKVRVPVAVVPPGMLAGDIESPWSEADG